MNDSYEHLKLCAARFVYRKKRDGLITFARWREWWQKKFDDDFYQYIESKQREKLNRKPI